MEKTYVVIHPNSPTPFDYSKSYDKLKELERIIQEENPIIINEEVPTFERIPKNKEILLCGLYKEICVQLEFNFLKEKGYNVKLYLPATLNA